MPHYSRREFNFYSNGVQLTALWRRGKRGVTYRSVGLPSLQGDADPVSTVWFFVLPKFFQCSLLRLARFEYTSEGSFSRCLLHISTNVSLYFFVLFLSFIYLIFGVLPLWYFTFKGSFGLHYVLLIQFMLDPEWFICVSLVVALNNCIGTITNTVLFGVDFFSFFACATFTCTYPSKLSCFVKLRMHH